MRFSELSTAARFCYLIALCACVIQLTCPSELLAQTARTPAELDFSSFIPAGAKLIKNLKVNFGVGRENEIVLAYGWDAIPMVKIGVRILEHRSAGWSVSYEESGSVINGAGPGDAIDVQKVRSSKGKEAVVVVVKNSGAGTTTDWHAVAYVNKRIIAIDPSEIRGRILNSKGYTFEGYNGVKVKNDLVVEEISGYSGNTARCCPDLPSLAISSRFTGTSFKLVSVKEVPMN